MKEIKSIVLDFGVTFEEIKGKQEKYNEFINEADVYVATCIEEQESCLVLVAYGENNELENLTGYIEDNK